MLIKIIKISSIITVIDIIQRAVVYTINYALSHKRPLMPALDTVDTPTTMNITTSEICSSPTDIKKPTIHQPTNKQQRKSRSFHLLIREIKRLRDENSTLRNSVALLKNDIRDATVSRQNTDASHKRFYDECMDKNSKLEMDLMDKEDEIRQLKKQIEDLQSRVNSGGGLTLHDAAYFKNKDSLMFGCYEFEEDEMQCQPVAKETALPEAVAEMDKPALDETISEVHATVEEENEEEEEEPQQSFEEVAISYIHQAILSKLSSARVRLELDDLIIKYDPTPEAISAALASAFLHWVSSSLSLMDKSQTAAKVFATKIQSGITDFWEAILQYYAAEEECQLQLLKQIELILTDADKLKFSGIIISHFDRLILMLYKYHVVDDDAVIAWWKDPASDTVSQQIRSVTTRFVEWVQEDDEESEQGDGEDDSDDDNDDADNTNNDDNDRDHEDDTNSSEIESEDEQEIINSILDTHNKYCCICLLETDNKTDSPTSMTKLNECSCYSKYSDAPAIPKPKKSVTISL